MVKCKYDETDDTIEVKYIPKLVAMFVHDTVQAVLVALQKLLERCVGWLYRYLYFCHHVFHSARNAWSSTLPGTCLQ